MKFFLTMTKPFLILANLASIPATICLILFFLGFDQFRDISLILSVFTTVSLFVGVTVGTKYDIEFKRIEKKDNEDIS